MILALIGLLYSILVSIVGVFIYRFKLFIFLTSWCCFIQLITFLHLLDPSPNPDLTSPLLVTSWTIGWVVFLIFWVFIFPLLGQSKFKRIPQYFSTHGGLHLIISAVFIQSDILITEQDLYWPVLVLIAYFFGLYLPLMSFGYRVYPISTVKIFIIVSLLTFGAFHSGLYLKSAPSQSTASKNNTSNS